MVLGIVLISAGILIAIYPQLLSLIVSFLLIFLGVMILLFRYQLKKMTKQWENPFIDFFIRF
jgi:Flp pilus assembly protein TadB